MKMAVSFRKQLDYEKRGSQTGNSHLQSLHILTLIFFVNVCVFLYCIPYMFIHPVDTLELWRSGLGNNNGENEKSKKAT